MNLPAKIKTAYSIWRKYGFSGLRSHFKFQFISLGQRFAYQKWIKEFDAINDEKRVNLRREIENFAHKPLISILLPVYNVDEKWLRLCIDSVRKQIYENWELCISDDCSPSPHIRPILKEYEKKDNRIKVIFRAENGHISAASNSALEIATGQFTALLDHDDELPEHALFYIAKEINEFPGAQMIYSDEDLINESGRRFGPKFKPDWSRDHFYSGNIVTHLSVYQTELLRRIGGFSPGLEGSQDYDLALRVIEQIDETHIRHIPRILYHWRVIVGSVAHSHDAKPYASDAARRAIKGHLERLGTKAEVGETIRILHRVRYKLPKELPKVSLILIADEDFVSTILAIERISAATEYSNLEIAVVCSKKFKQEFEPEINRVKMRPTENLGIFANPSENPTEAEMYNHGVAKTAGGILCFVDINLRPAAGDWLKELVSFSLQNEIGAAGGKLLYANGTVLHGGLLIGVGDTIGVAHQEFPAEREGSMLRNRIINNFSAVSVSCMTTRRGLFEETGGFDSENFPNRFFDVDYCLKLREKKFRVVWTPYAELIQIDSQKHINLQKKASVHEHELFEKKWPMYMDRDPFYNSNLSRKNGHFLIKQR